MKLHRAEVGDIVTWQGAEVERDQSLGHLHVARVELPIIHLRLDLVVHVLVFRSFEILANVFCNRYKSLIRRCLHHLTYWHLNLSGWNTLCMFCIARAGCPHCRWQPRTSCRSPKLALQQIVSRHFSAPWISPPPPSIWEYNFIIFLLSVFVLHFKEIDCRYSTNPYEVCVV